MIVGLFLDILLPLSQEAHLPRLANGVIYGLARYLVLAITTDIGTTWILFKPLPEWQRHLELHDPRWVRYLVMRVPIYQALLDTVTWSLNVIVSSAVTFVYGSKIGVMVLITSVLGSAMMALLIYLIAGRMVCPVVVEALTCRVPDSLLEPPVGHRLCQTRVLTSGISVMATLLVLLGQRRGMFTDDAAGLPPTITALATLALTTDYFSTILVSMSIVDPIRGLTDAINKIRQGQADICVPIYDGSEMGVPRAGSNEMMRGLQERQRVHDLFSHCVGSGVARRALEEEPTLDGEDRLVTALFVDVIGSTNSTEKNSPEVVVCELNVLFDHVVDCVYRNKDIIGEFQDDAALAVFDAPLPLDDTAGHVLTAARELCRELLDLQLSVGIGVPASHIVAGHIGARDRFEYTVIGDAVSQAARLTELAKGTSGRILVTASVIRLVSEDRQARWITLKSVELRDRTYMTQLACPVRPTPIDEAQGAVDSSVLRCSYCAR